VDLKKKVMSSHYTPNTKWTNELWGLAVIHNTSTFVTCSDDGTLRKWSYLDKNYK
jgi:microtubule-associated protein-like 6